MAKKDIRKYSVAMRVLHWSLALLLISLLVAGTLMHNSQEDATKFALLKLHAPIGFLAGILMCVRTFFAFKHARPHPDDGWPKPIIWISKTIHILLYVLPFALVFTGTATMALSGLGNILRLGLAEVWPDLSSVGPAFGHSTFAKLFVASLTLHIAGALYHQYWMKDNLLHRMNFKK